MNEKFTVWWVGKTTEKGVNVVREMFCDEEEAIKYAKKHGFGPPKKHVAQNLMEEIAIKAQMHWHEEDVKNLNERLEQKPEKEIKKTAEVKKEPGTIIKKIELELVFDDDFVPPKGNGFGVGSAKECDNCPFCVWIDDYGYGECTLCNAVVKGDDENRCPLKKFFDEKL